MKQYQHHPARDEVLEFDLPDDAVYFAVGGPCPTCAADRRVTDIDFVKQKWRCGWRQHLPIETHEGMPRARWFATVPKDGPAYVTVEVGVERTVIWPRVLSGAEADGGALLLDTVAP